MLCTVHSVLLGIIREEGHQLKKGPLRIWINQDFRGNKKSATSQMLSQNLNIVYDSHLIAENIQPLLNIDIKMGSHVGCFLHVQYWTILSK